MTYEIHCYNSQKDFDEVRFVRMAYDLTRKPEAMRLGRRYLSDFPIVKVQSDDREFIEILEREVSVDLRWLVERALAIRTAPGWTKAERELSWADWEIRAVSALAKGK